MVSMESDGLSGTRALCCPKGQTWAGLVGMAWGPPIPACLTGGCLPLLPLQN